MAGGSEIRVENIREGETVKGLFLVRSKTLRTARNGRPFLSMELGDKTGSLETRVWDAAERLDAACDAGDIVSASGRVTSYQGRLQFNVEALERVPPEAVILEDFMPSSAFSLDEMFAALRDIVDGVGEPHVRALLTSLMEDPQIGPRMRVASAAKGMHHAYIGGLLEHTLSMCVVLLRLHEHYDRLMPGVLDRDLLVAGAFLHDLGKVLELESGPTFDYTTDGRLVGHIVQGVELITAKAATIEGFPSDILARIKHLVLAHHGRLEYGSPKTPHMAEAFLLHVVDLLDARLNAMHTAFRAEAGHDWTAFNRMMEVFLLNPFGAVPTDDEGAAVLPHRDPGWMRPMAESVVATPKAKSKREGGDAAEDDAADKPKNLSLF